MRNFYHPRSDPGFGLGFQDVPKRPRLTYFLIGLNAVLLVAMEIAGGSTDSKVLLDFGAMFGPSIADGQYWRLFTAMFLHVGFIHLAFNIFGLWVFGRMVERIFGVYRFAFLYVLSGLFGSVISYLLSPVVIAVGASGAVFGIIGVMAAYFAVQRHVMGRMALQNLYGLLALAAINLVFGLLTPGIDNWAHLGGFVAGFVLGYALAPQYTVVRSLLGQPTGLSEHSGKWKGRLWVIPLTITILAVGVGVGNATLPDNIATYVLNTERMIKDGNFDSARSEIEKAFEINVGPSLTIGRAFYLRGLIREEFGDREGAIADMSRAATIADSETRKAAIARLTHFSGTY